MKQLRSRTLLTGSVALGLTLAACSSPAGDDRSAAPSAPSQPSSCPADDAARGAGPGGTPPSGAFPGGAPPSGAFPGGPPGGAPSGGADLSMATSVAPSDTSTSKVITPSGPQIQCGKTPTETHRDIVFAKPSSGGKAMQLMMDVLVPKTGGRKPLVVYLSGGGFQMASKEAGLDQRTYLAESGYAVASIQYRTIAVGAIYSDGVADVKSAIRYLRAHAAEYDIDPQKVAVYGESAGGYLSAMVGTTNGVKRFDTGGNLDQSSAVQAVVDKFGPSDLSKVGADFDDTARKANTAPGNFLAQWVFGPGTKKSVTADPAVVARANPVTYVDSSDPPFLLLHGSADTLVSPSQTLLLHTALRAKSVDSTRYVLTGAGHGDLSFLGNAQAGQPWTTREVMDDIVTFLGEHLGG